MMGMSGIVRQNIYTWMKNNISVKAPLCLLEIRITHSRNTESIVRLKKSVK